MENNLPKGWEVKKLVEHVPIIKTGVERFNGEKSYYSTGSISDNEMIPEGEFTFRNRPARANRLVLEKDVVQARMREAQKAILIDKNLKGSLLSTGFLQFRPEDNNYNSKLFYYYLQSDRFLKQRDECATGSTQVALTDEGAENIDLVVPPQKQQKRIADKLDVLLTKVKDAQYRLDKIPLILKRFRQSILAAACSGRLTSDWRKENSNEESATSLLIRINEERQTLLKRSLIKKTSFDNVCEILDVPYELPESWSWCKFNDITRLITDGKHGDCKNQVNSGYYFLSAKDIQGGRLIYENARQINYNQFIEVHKRTNLEAGDICLVNTGATVGKIAIVQSGELASRTTFQKSVAIIKILNNFVNNRYIAFVLRSNSEKLLNKSAGSAVNNLLISTIKEFLIPLPPVAEQKEIVRRVESLFALADKIENRYNKAKVQIGRIEQSILAKAFRGELTP